MHEMTSEHIAALEELEQILGEVEANLRREKFNTDVNVQELLDKESEKLFHKLKEARDRFHNLCMTA